MRRPSQEGLFLCDELAIFSLAAGTAGMEIAAMPAIDATRKLYRVTLTVEGTQSGPGDPLPSGSGSVTRTIDASRMAGSST